MSKETSKQTRGKLQRALSQRIQAWYRTNLGYQPSPVTCQLFNSKLAIIIENSICRPVQLLVNNGKPELAEQVRSNIDKAIEPKIKDLIEQVLGVSVIDMLTDTTLETGRTGTIAVLASEPLPSIGSIHPLERTTGVEDGD